MAFLRILSMSSSVPSAAIQYKDFYEVGVIMTGPPLMTFTDVMRKEGKHETKKVRKTYAKLD